jgi:ATP-dependent Lon protease
MEDEALQALMRYYTREAGVRQLERNWLCGAQAGGEGAGGETRAVCGERPTSKRSWGPRKFHYGVAEEQDEIGVVTGLAVNSFGGDTLPIEVSLSEGNGRITLTGSLGDVMRESAQAALTYARANARSLGLEPAIFDKVNLHIHVPDGAVPKDGPSAGIGMATAIISAFTRRPVRRDVAMTGEVTLRGKVLAIGGLKEKAIAAHRAGIKTVLLPKDNAKDIPGAAGAGAPGPGADPGRPSGSGAADCAAGKQPPNKFENGLKSTWRRLDQSWRLVQSKNGVIAI